MGGVQVVAAPPARLSEKPARQITIAHRPITAADCMPTELPPFTGTELMHADVERVFATLTDLGGIAPLLPGLVSHEVIDARTMKAVVRPGFSFVRTTMKLTFALGETQPPAHAAMNIMAAGIGAGMEIEANVQLAPAEAGATRVDWQARVKRLSGLLTHVGPSLIQGAANQVIADGWTAVRRKIEAAG